MLLSTAAMNIPIITAAVMSLRRAGTAGTATAISGEAWSGTGDLGGGKWRRKLAQGGAKKSPGKIGDCCGAIAPVAVVRRHSPMLAFPLGSPRLRAAGWPGRMPMDMLLSLLPFL